MTHPTDAAAFGRFAVSLGAFRLELCFSVAAGEVLVLFGPSGAGKTTALRAHRRAGPAQRGAHRHRGGGRFSRPATATDGRTSGFLPTGAASAT